MLAPSTMSGVDERPGPCVVQRLWPSRGFLVSSVPTANAHGADCTFSESPCETPFSIACLDTGSLWFLLLKGDWVLESLTHSIR